MAVPDSSTPRVRLFESELLEKFSLISPRTFAVVWSLVLLGVVWAGWGTASHAEALGLFAAGLLVWVLFEYAMHRYLFHLKLKHPRAQWLIFLIHGNHHDYPNDPLRDMMPLAISLPLSGMIWAGCVAALGSAGSWLFLGFILGYVAYDTIHYACHQWRMNGVIGSALKQHHMRHHFISETGNYAISAIFLDNLFGTKIRSVRAGK